MSESEGVPIERLEKWRLRNATPPPVVPRPRTKLAPEGVSAVDVARAAAGLDPIAKETPPVDPATPQEAAPVVPTITPEQLLVMIRGVDRVTIGSIGRVKYSGKLGLERFEKLAKLPEEDEKTLEALAPYAAPYASTVLAYAGPIMAGVFCACWGMSIVTRLKAMDNEAKESAKR